MRTHHSPHQTSRTAILKMFCGGYERKIYYSVFYIFLCSFTRVSLVKYYLICEKFNVHAVLKLDIKESSYCRDTNIHDLGVANTISSRDYDATIKHAKQAAQYNFTKSYNTAGRMSIFTLVHCCKIVPIDLYYTIGNISHVRGE